MTGTVLRKVRYLDPLSQTDQVADVWIAAGKIRAIAPNLALDVDAHDVDVIHAEGQFLMPGLVDLYSHSGEPGHEARETLASLMASAIAGGFTRVGILPDTQPALDNPGTLRHLLDVACELPQAPQPRLLPWAALTQGANGQHMTELAELAALKPLALAGFADGQPLHQLVLLRRLLEYGRPLGRMIALWPCDRTLTGDGVARDGAIALMGGLPGSPTAAETAPLAALLELVAEVGTPVHIMRVSTARSVELIAQAKARGLPITASTTWMHLLFSTEDALTYDPNLRLDPPLGNPPDQQTLMDAVRAGIVDAIAIDHSPYTYEEKTVGFSSAPPGVIGLELAFAVLWQRFVAEGDWSPFELLRALSTHPAQCLGQPPAAIAPDSPIEAVLFDPTIPWQITASALHSRSRNTPFLNQTMTGRVIRVWNS